MLTAIGQPIEILEKKSKRAHELFRQLPSLGIVARLAKQLEIPSIIASLFRDWNNVINVASAAKRGSTYCTAIFLRLSDSANVGQGMGAGRFVLPSSPKST